MATVTITLIDQDNGGLTVNIISDPPFSDADEEYTHAQAAGAHAFDAANLYLGGDEDDDGEITPRGLPS